MDGARVEKTWQVTEAGVQRSLTGNGKNQRGTRNATGRRLNRPLLTKSKRTLDVERSQRANGHRGNATNRRSATLGQADKEPLGNRTSAIHPSKGQQTSGRDVA